MKTIIGGIIMCAGLCLLSVDIDSMSVSALWIVAALVLGAILVCVGGQAACGKRGRRHAR